MRTPRACTNEELDALVNQTIPCFEDSGVDDRRIADRELTPALLFPGYCPGEPVAVGEKCVAEYGGCAELAYQRKLSVIKAHDTKFETTLPQILTSLREHDEATRDEVFTSASKLNVEITQSTTHGAVIEEADCLLFEF